MGEARGAEPYFQTAGALNLHGLQRTPFASCKLGVHVQLQLLPPVGYGGGGNDGGAASVHPQAAGSGYSSLLHRTEVMVMTAVQHPYILRLLGVATLGETLAMVSEFVPHGDVDLLLERVRNREDSFDWTARMVLAEQVGEALVFIHSKGYIHRDFKSANVLLGEGMVPKVADFGMARLVEDWKTHVTTRVGGSQGYIDPNYFSTGFLTNHCDTYAFGIFLLELMSGECAEENGFKAIRVAAEERLIPLEKLKRVVMDKTIAGQWSEEHVSSGRGGAVGAMKSFGKMMKNLSSGMKKEKPAAPHPDLKPLGGDGAPPMYTKAELSAATNNFKHKLGEGGFGAVYKGYLKVESGAEAAESLGVDLSAVSDGEIPVAVKMCAAKVLSAREQLMTEMMVMGKLRHPNILRLLGACISDDSMAMIYEFIPCGDVHELLEDARAGKEEFKYEDRMKVAMGCAEALAFIHGQEYVHRDFKAPNVLLAEGLSPRVADFGLARIVENWKDHVTTRVMGSRGYIDPEYFESGYLNEHCDTFAFGIFLIELATGHSVLEAKFDDVVNGAVRSDDVDLGAVMDPRLQGQWSEEQAKTLLGVAKVCITTDWDDRPTMDNVVEMMQGVM
ncbi:unnamed protein product [Closterium sp. NIES-64]|nr:unnamed protein product [Closterium sp. NIES-64]